MGHACHPSCRCFPTCRALAPSSWPLLVDGTFFNSLSVGEASTKYPTKFIQFHQVAIGRNDEADPKNDSDHPWAKREWHGCQQHFCPNKEIQRGASFYSPPVSLKDVDLLVFEAKAYPMLRSFRKMLLLKALKTKLS